MNCFVCGSKKLGRLESGDCVIDVCMNCGAGHTENMPGRGAYPAEYYVGRGALSFIGDAVMRHFRKRRAGYLAGLRQKPGRILDVGCGKGWTLLELKKAGWEVFGTELSVTSAWSARKMGLDVHEGDITEAGLPEGSFDMITAWHVLEHLNDPAEMLSRMPRLLKDDGLLVVEVPDFGSWTAGRFGPDWFHLDPARHVSHFTRASLIPLLTLAGYEVVSLESRSFEQDVCGFVQSLLNRMGGNQGLYRLLRGRKVSLREVLPQLLAAPAVALLSVVVVPVMWRLHGGGVIRCVCRKRTVDHA